MRYTVIGAGMMGSAAAYDLAHMDTTTEVTLADIDPERASQAAAKIGPNVKPIRLDVNNDADLKKALAGRGAAVSAVSYTVNYRISKAAMEAGVHVIDLGGNNDVVSRQQTLHEEAKRKDVTIVPNSGLAPGLTSVLVMTGIREFETLDSIHIRVGGLPQHPKPPLNYQLVFAVEGLINEYIEKAVVIRDGKKLIVDSMVDVEEIEFPPPFGKLEAFNTSGGVSTMAALMEGKVRNLDYKTIRYKGHCEKFKTLLDLGFAGNEPIIAGPTVRTAREFFEQLLRKKLDHGDKDVVLARVVITGRKDGRNKGLEYEFIDYFDDSTAITAMMRTTAFPTSIIAQMLAEGTIKERGVLPPESCVPGDLMITELAKRRIMIQKRVR
jgi:lysine 6-dehydrogenase